VTQLTIEESDAIARNDCNYNVAFISHTSILGGAERALLEIVEGLSSRGFRCTVFLPSHGPLEEAFLHIGVRCLVVEYSWWSNPKRKFRRNLASLLAVYKCWKIFRRQPFDVVYTNTMMVPSGALAAKLYGIPHIWHIHEFGVADHGLHLDIGDRLGRWLIGRLSARVLCVSDAVRGALRGAIPDHKLATVYGAVRIPEMARAVREPEPRSHLVCALVGVLKPSKGQKEAVEAMGILAKSGIRVQLLLVGSGPMDDELRQLIRRQGLEDSVTLVGLVQNPFKFVDRADIVLMCSRCEAFARPVLEGMMMGKPIVGTRSGGTIEAVRDGFNGLLYTPGDADDLAAKIKMLGDDLSRAKQFGENGRLWSSHEFTMDRLLTKISDHIKKAVRDKRGDLTSPVRGYDRQPGGLSPQSARPASEAETY
jgi:glycosyltransferase involved in cell wall biosynthesis